MVRPKEKTIVGCRWFFTLKYRADETLERYKARLIAKRYTQTFGKRDICTSCEDEHRKKIVTLGYQLKLAAITV